MKTKLRLSVLVVDDWMDGWQTREYENGIFKQTFNKMDCVFETNCMLT